MLLIIALTGPLIILVFAYCAYRLYQQIQKLRVQLAMTTHQLDKTRGHLQAAYKVCPAAHYVKCSAYAREKLFHVSEDGVISYSSFNEDGSPIQHCEPPFYN
jgi:hypothetical protein